MKPTSPHINITPIVHLGSLVYRHRHTIADRLMDAAFLLRNWSNFTPLLDIESFPMEAAPTARKRFPKASKRANRKKA